MSTANTVPKRFDGYATFAFCFAFFVMLMPLESDILFSLMVNHAYWSAGILELACFAVALCPFILSWQRHHREPGVWKGRGYLIATAAILTLRAAWWGWALLSWLLQRAA
jgi:hypothetical protein